MTIFVDTSALYAVIDSDDAFYERASRIWVSLVDKQAVLVTNNYVVIESIALLQRHIGLAAVQTFQNDMVPWLSVEYTTEIQHSESMSLLLVENRRRLSLVDCSAFVTMRRLGIRQVFTFDRHFSERGFEIIPME